MAPSESRLFVTEPFLRNQFRAWLADLDDKQAAALADNWENVMNDAALDRIDSWVIADAAIAELRKDHEHERRTPDAASPGDGVAQAPQEH